MTQFTVEEEIQIPTSHKTIDDLLHCIYKNYQFEDSNINDPYQLADKMQKNELPKGFIDNFIKSYDR
ncbi:MAG: hypothetical protein H6767_01690 [Candidatus Peribacteria bacterium]|nr:MAG: hypothetical protein H6767_01690 [Candidatus Peribacteria bacterium]